MSHPRFSVGFLAILLGSFWAGTGVRAQQRPQTPEIPPAESKVLDTKDGIQLKVAWFPATKEKEAIPFLLVHDWNGVGADYAALAEYLQQQGHAVIVPDLRGHGESVRRRGVGDVIDREKFGKVEIASTLEDLETCKRFLMEQNNVGKLNIDMLTVVAAGDMSIIAVDWALRDWSWPPIAGRKQGQDVKALVLLSPSRSFKGLSINPALRNPLLSGRGAVPLSLLIAAGERGGAIRDARAIFESLERSRPKTETTGVGQDLFLDALPVDFQGTALVDPRANLTVHERIAGFAQFRVGSKSDVYRWTDRTPRE